jgi:hypothetical protein
VGCGEVSARSDLIFPPVTPRACGPSPLGLRLAKRPARGAPGLCSADLAREWLRSSHRLEVESPRIRACSKSLLSDACTACITETPHPPGRGL